MTFSMHKVMKQAIAFVDQIDLLAQEAADGKEKRDLEYMVKEARDLLKYNEWFIAFEILTSNLAEIGYKMDQELIDSAKEIYLKANPSESEETLWWLNEMRKDQ